ncbi:hypothetical protein RP20_CCG003318 [Aedes albopictus]|nr:hypothetical protein RP20_CCG003318 [Aedes albopictus]
MQREWPTISTTRTITHQSRKRNTALALAANGITAATWTLPPTTPRSRGEAPNISSPPKWDACDKSSTREQASYYRIKPIGAARQIAGLGKSVRAVSVPKCNVVRRHRDFSATESELPVHLEVIGARIRRERKEPLNRFRLRQRSRARS